MDDWLTREKLARGERDLACMKAVEYVMHCRVVLVVFVMREFGLASASSAWSSSATSSSTAFCWSKWSMRCTCVALFCYDV